MHHDHGAGYPLGPHMSRYHAEYFFDFDEPHPSHRPQMEPQSFTIKRKGQEIDLTLECADGEWQVNVFIEINDCVGFHDPPSGTYKSEFARFCRYREFIAGYTGKTNHRDWSTEHILDRLKDL